MPFGSKKRGRTAPKHSAERGVVLKEGQQFPFNFIKKRRALGPGGRTLKCRMGGGLLRRGMKK